MVYRMKERASATGRDVAGDVYYSSFFTQFFSVCLLLASECLMLGLSNVLLLKEWCLKFNYSNNI